MPIEAYPCDPSRALDGSGWRLRWRLQQILCMKMVTYFESANKLVII